MDNYIDGWSLDQISKLISAMITGGASYDEINDVLTFSAQFIDYRKKQLECEKLSKQIELRRLYKKYIPED